MIKALDYYKGRKRQVTIEVPNFDKGFVVRQFSGEVMLFFGQKPYCDTVHLGTADEDWWPNNEIYPMHLPTETFPEVSWENKECLEVELDNDRLIIKNKPCSLSLKDLERRVELTEDIIASSIDLCDPPHKIKRWRKKLEKYKAELKRAQKEHNP